MANERLCVFCGELPVARNNEHILPEWLLKLTGDPTRVVNFGLNYKTGKVITFAWQSLAVPACESCNDRFAIVESKVRHIVVALLARQALSANDYVTLLDWLDKVRVGLWLNYQLIQIQPSVIAPHFHIVSRIKTKDRFEVGRQ